MQVAGGEPWSPVLRMLLSRTRWEGEPGVSGGTVRLTAPRPVLLVKLVCEAGLERGTWEMDGSGRKGMWSPPSLLPRGEPSW